MFENSFKINTTFSIQLQKKKDALGYKNVDDFLNAITSSCSSFNYSAVRSWYYGTSIPDIKKLYNLCDFLKCDIDYLFGRIDCSTKAYEQLKKETNISENAIKYLQNDIPVPTKSLFPTDGVKPLSAAVNYLLITEHGRDLLQHIYDYVHSDSLSLSYQGKKITEDIKINSSQSNSSYKLSPKEYDSVLLGQIQQDLVLMKHTDEK